MAIANLLCINFLYAQNDHLEPSEDFVNRTGVLRDYFAELQPKLFHSFSDSPLARLVVIPSFSGEYAFALENDLTTM